MRSSINSNQAGVGSIVIILLMLAVVIFGMSCRTQKHITKEKKSVDSVSTTTKDSTGVRTKDSVAVYEETFDWASETYIVYDTVRLNDTVFVYYPKIQIIREKGNYKKKDSVAVNSKDTASKSEVIATDYKSEEESYAKDVDRKPSFTFWLLMILILIAVILFIRYGLGRFKIPPPM